MWNILKMAERNRRNPNFYTRYHDHGAIQGITFWRSAKIVLKKLAFWFFLNTGPSGAGNFKVLFLPQFLWSRSKLYWVFKAPGPLVICRPQYAWDKKMRDWSNIIIWILLERCLSSCLIGTVLRIHLTWNLTETRMYSTQVEFTVRCDWMFARAHYDWER